MNHWIDYLTGSQFFSADSVDDAPALIVAALQQSHQQRLSSYTSGSAYEEVIAPAMYEEICEVGRSVLARATKTLEEETSTAGNHQVIGSYVEMLGRKRKRGTEVNEGARHKLPKHDVFVVIRSLVHHLPRKSADSNTKHTVEASENGEEGRANRKRANPFVFIEHDVEFIKKRKLDLVKETTAKTSTVISSDPDSLSVCGMIDECDAPSVYQTMSRFDFRDSVGGRSTSQIILEFVKDAIVKPLRVAGLTRVLVPFSLVGEMRAAIVSLKDKGIHLMKDWDVTIPGHEVFHDCAREGSNHGVLLGISKGHVAQRIPGIEENLEDTSTMEADEIAATFVEISKKIAVDLTLYKASSRRPKRFYLTPSILKKIRAKDLAAAEWHKATESKNPSKKVKMLYLAFSKKRKEVKELIRAFNRNRWANFLDKGEKIVASQNGREHWKWVRRLLSESLYTKHKLSAVRDETGNLLTSPDKVMQRWSEFYTALSSDSSSNSRNPDRWIEVLGNKKDNPLDINHDISWDEVRMVLMSLALHKAPGGDGLEVGWYKIPKNWNITEIVPIPKTGDLKLLDNYRGIALIPAGMKILGRIIIGRITRQLEARKKISFLQAGFRRGEEAMAQVVSLYDILSRLRVAKKETFVAFIDFSSFKIGFRENLMVAEKWANDNDMFFGISKCGALAVGGSFEYPEILELQGQRVPIVKEYWYLGVLINDELDLL
ncbi:LINE-1 retrotransposable element ORF2 protein [Smittium culicis]|uniref:LINE-1 retrotransposable element ORF2 protein n=1 Tax=Smittium culicis TaxID=133412 RepID=A0A1R1YKK2_9FUNG|nr:LINE-1 retrotransposable element ORF2 protein [Smittium culicis]